MSKSFFDDSLFVAIDQPNISGPIARPLTPQGIERKLSQIAQPASEAGGADALRQDKEKSIFIICSVNLFFDWKSLKRKIYRGISDGGRWGSSNS